MKCLIIISLFYFITEEKYGQSKVLIVVPIFLFQDNKSSKTSSANDDEIKSDSTTSDVGTVRRIDAGVLSFKPLLISLFVVVISVATFLYFQGLELNVDDSL